MEERARTFQQRQSTRNPGAAVCCIVSENNPMAPQCCKKQSKQQASTSSKYSVLKIVISWNQHAQKTSKNKV
jgi:hypothetical protein